MQIISHIFICCNKIYVDIVAPMCGTFSILTVILKALNHASVFDALELRMGGNYH